MMLSYFVVIIVILLYINTCICYLSGLRMIKPRFLDTNLRRKAKKNFGTLMIKNIQDSK